jgi:hypothetical protein
MRPSICLLYHPQSSVDIPSEFAACPDWRVWRVACGMARHEQADYSEANDFHPNYASRNSAIFETSVILTMWEHADAVFGDDPVCFLHTDVVPRYTLGDTIAKLRQFALDGQTVGLTVYTDAARLWAETTLPDDHHLRARNDSMIRSPFSAGINVWELLKRHAPDDYQWAMDENPQMVYGHQFMCPRPVFDSLGARLLDFTNRLRLSDVGLWTPHVCERLIAIHLARHSKSVVLSTLFLHRGASSATGPGSYALYGIKGYRHYRTISRQATLHQH